VEQAWVQPGGGGGALGPRPRHCCLRLVAHQRVEQRPGRKKSGVTANNFVNSNFAKSLSLTLFLYPYLVRRSVAGKGIKLKKKWKIGYLQKISCEHNPYPPKNHL
jgi:hypothetical protein